jgi:carboxyl-terminal processing protease
MRTYFTWRLWALLICFLLISLEYHSASGQSQQLMGTNGIQKYSTLMQIIDYYYVDSVNVPKLVDKAIVETLKELDPHSAYISKKDLERANEPLVGNFEGIGVQFEILKDTITIVHPIPGGPSEKLGIMSGDKIIRIEGENVAGKKIDNQFVFDRLRGKMGTKVTVSIFRKGKKDLIDYTIVRDKIPINSIDASYMITPSTGYINLNRFSGTSMDEFHNAIRKLKERGLQDLIIDLRNNSGGYMNTAIDLADEFLPSGDLIVYTEGMRSPRVDYRATSKGELEKGRVVLIINENSASASEIVSGAIQDWDRGIIIGRRSFGKGLVQRPYDLPDGSQVRLTTARYHTPSGRCIQMSYADGSDKYYEAFRNRFKHGESENSDSIKFPDSLKYYTSHRRVVYGAGGIMPDVFIPLDTSNISDYFLDLRRKNVINLFVSDYVDDQRSLLIKSYPDFATYDKKFNVDENFMKGFFEAAEKAGVKKDEKGYETAEKLIKNQLKALIAQKLWDINAFYEVINQYDNEVQKAVNVIRDDALFSKLKVQE